MITICHFMQNGDESSEPEPLHAEHPFEVISLIAVTAIPAGAYFTEVKERAIIMEGCDGDCRTVTTFVGPPEEMAAVIAFVYHYMTVAEEASTLPTSDMLVAIEARIAERGNHPSLANEVPPEPESEELKRAVLHACGVTDPDDFAAGLDARIHCIAVAALFAEEPGISFVIELKELMEDPEFNIDE